MIIEIPDGDDYTRSGIELLNLAWTLAVGNLHSNYQMDEMVDLNEVERAEADAAYWRKSQPQLGNALSLIQQAMELLLKGRIAEVSPFLLIVRDPREYPKGSANADIPFSDFRSIDAADLVKVNNAVCEERLDEGFKRFFDDVRRQRNSFIHGVRTPTPLTVPDLIVMILEAYTHLNEGRWPAERMAHAEHDEFAAFGVFDGYTYHGVIVEILDAIRALSQGDALKFFGYDKRRISFICLNCYGQVESQQRDDFPKIAQLLEPELIATDIWCCICNETQSVSRKTCLNTDCGETVFAIEDDVSGRDAMCLTCAYSETDLRRFEII